MRQTELIALAPALLELARQAGDAILNIYESGNADLREKTDHSPLTAADLAAHRCLVEALPAIVDCPVVSEEDEASHGDRTPQGSFWLIDPLDGTREFVARNGEFTVNVALVDEGCSILGVVHLPVLGETYWGGPGLGAWCLRGGAASPIHVAAEPGGSCRVVASKSHLNEATTAFINKLGPVQLVQAGSSLKFCRLAEGAADIYPRLAPTCEWDTAAAQAVLEGAGGVVLDLDGRPLRYGKPAVLNPSFIALRDPTLLPS